MTTTRTLPTQSDAASQQKDQSRSTSRLMDSAISITGGDANNANVPPRHAANRSLGIPLGDTELNRWSTHLIRLTAANLLHRQKFLDSYIQNRRRWKNDAFRVTHPTRSIPRTSTHCTFWRATFRASTDLTSTCSSRRQHLWLHKKNYTAGIAQCNIANRDTELKDY